MEKFMEKPLRTIMYKGACENEYWLPFAIEAAMLEDSMTVTSHENALQGGKTL